MPHQAGLLSDVCCEPLGGCVFPLPSGAASAPSRHSAATAIKAFVFRKLVTHLQVRVDVQNMALMTLSGFCRNCLSKWLFLGCRASNDAGPPTVLEYPYYCLFPSGISPLIEYFVAGLSLLSAFCTGISLLTECFVLQYPC